MSNDHEVKIDMQRIKILSILPPNVELAAKTNGKLFTSDREGKTWLYTDLEGILCFLLDYQNKTTYLALFDVYSFEKLFQYELYRDFSKYFLTIAPDFRCFETESGFIGIQFDSDGEANLFDVAVKKFSGRLLDNIFQANVVTRKADENATKDKVKSFCKALKQNWSSGAEKKYDENYIEEGLEIVKARNFEVLNNISFDRELKQFKVGEIPDELKNVFMSAGIRKKDLKDVDFAFNCYKIIIMGISGDNKTTTKQIDYIPHVFDPPDDDGKPEGEEGESAMNISQPKPIIAKKTKKKEEKKFKKAEKKQVTQPTVPSTPYTQKVPEPPSSIPSVPTNMTQSTPSITMSIPSSIPVPPPIPATPSVSPFTLSNPATPSPSTVPNPPSGSSIPSIPAVPVPPPISFTPVAISTISQSSQPEMSREDELKSIKLKPAVVEEKPKELSMYEQIKNVKLSKVVKEPTQAPKIITKNERTFLQNALSTAIKMRKMNLQKHEEESEDSDDDSDW